MCYLPFWTYSSLKPNTPSKEGLIESARWVWNECIISLANGCLVCILLLAPRGRNRRSLSDIAGSSLPTVHLCHMSISIPIPGHSSLPLPLLSAAAQSLFDQHFSLASLLLFPNICSLFLSLVLSTWLADFDIYFDSLALSLPFICQVQSFW